MYFFIFFFALNKKINSQPLYIVVKTIFSKKKTHISFLGYPSKKKKKKKRKRLYFPCLFG